MKQSVAVRKFSSLLLITASRLYSCALAAFRRGADLQKRFRRAAFRIAPCPLLALPLCAQMRSPALTEGIPSFNCHLDSTSSETGAERGEEMDPCKRILIVEDDPVVRQILAIALIDFGYTVHLAKDGVSALEEIKVAAPDILLSDLNMPRMGGYELLSIVRRHYPHIRLVAMSGAYIGEQFPLGLAADAFYPKGNNPAMLFDLLTALPHQQIEEQHQ